MRRVVAGAALAAALTSLAAVGASSAAAQGISGGPTRVVTVRDPRIAESSGLVVSPSHADLVWTVDDSGSDAVVHGVSTRTGRTRAVLRLRDGGGEPLDARDMEAMAAGRDGDGRPVVWVGDIGDNRAVRESVVLRLFVEPSSVRSQAVRATSLRLRYPEGPVDAETLVWTWDRRLLVVTKSLLRARVLEVPRAAVRRALAGRDVTEPVVAQQVATVPETLATDGTALPDGRLVVRGYGSATVYGWVDGGLQALEQLELPEQPQGETVAAERSGTSVLVGSEGVRQPLWRVPLARAVAPSPTRDPRTLVATRTAAAAGEQRRASSSWTPSWAALGAVGGGAVALAGAGAAVRGARRRGRRTR